MALSGFPEPCLEGSQRLYGRWKRSHLDIIVRQDLLELEHVVEIMSIELLIELLRKRTGSPLSLRSLATDLQCGDKTVKRWLMLLGHMYVVFRVAPNSRNIACAVQKASKYCFHDTGLVQGDEGAKLENFAANALLKEIHYRRDVLGEDWKLTYLRTAAGLSPLLTQEFMSQGSMETFRPSIYAQLPAQ